jgi:hypothetical protein
VTHAFILALADDVKAVTRQEQGAFRAWCERTAAFS